MKKIYSRILVAVLMLFGVNSQAQRYLTEVFTDAEITVSTNQVYATNYTLLPLVLGSGGPAAQPLTANIYYPSVSVDTETERPLIIYIPTGNFLPPVVNGSPNGSKLDSSAVNIAKQLARRGYVCAVIDYRLGWDPTSSLQVVRTGTILNAAYKGQQDSKAAVRFFRADNAGANIYKIDPNRIALLGEGTGAYVAMAHAYLDKPGKIARLPGLGGTKFLRTLSPDSSVVDTLKVGNFDGTNEIAIDPSGLATAGLMGFKGNMANNPTFSSSVNLVISMGGAMGDSSWIDDGQIPMIGIQAVRDPNAPYGLGDVIVPTQPIILVIPWASGAEVNLTRINEFGNNSSFSNKIFNDPITVAVEALYGQSVIFDGEQILIGNGKGLLPFILPEAASRRLNHGSPWQFWSATQPSALAEVPTLPGLGITTHIAASESNPFMAQSDLVGRNTALVYIDTVQRFINPRIVCALDLEECNLFQTIGFATVASGTISAYPNPSTDAVMLTTSAGIETVELFDITGKLVQSVSGLNTSSFQVNRNGLGKGIYLARVGTKDGLKTVKLIFE